MNFFRKFFAWLKAEQVHKREINYLFFAFLILLCFLSYAHFLWSIPLFFFIYAVGQILFEICGLLLIAFIIKRWAPKWVLYLSVTLFFVLLLIQYTHFTLLRIMDVSISYMFKFFFGSGLKHLIVAFQALNLNWTFIWIILSTIVALPLAGFFLYWSTQKISLKAPWRLSLGQIALAFCTIGLFLFFLDIASLPLTKDPNFTKFQKRLPFGKSFLSAAHPEWIELPGKFAPPRNEALVSQMIPDTTLVSRPNIYFFVIETLRSDFVDKATAPHLTAFGEENIAFPKGFANANATQLSWFALFHSNFPYHWADVRDTWQGGSLPLRYLKKMGYKIRVYSSSDLVYFNMDQLLFGQNRHLADHIEEYTSIRTIEPCERDAMALNAFARDIKDSQEGTLFIVFLDSTHSEYSYPKDFPLKFKPVADQIDYLTLGPSQEELEGIKNRYRNSIHYVDQLMGKFFDVMKSHRLYDKAIVSITGDHGEEFFEEGALFHGTHLNDYQIQVPIYLKFPDKKWSPQPGTKATHVDLFPTLIHYLTHQEFSAVDGRSIFSPNPWPYMIAVSQNGSETPREIYLIQKEGKFRTQFLSHGRLYDQSNLQVLKSEGDSSLHLPGALAPLLQRD